MRFATVLSCLVLAFLPVSPVVGQAAKPVVSVDNIDDATGSNLSAQFITMLESAVSSTGRFRLIERNRLDAMQRECALAKGGVVRKGSGSANAGCTTTAIDYKIYGGITTAQVRQTSNALCGLLVKDMQCNGVEITLAVDMRITDVKSSELLRTSAVNLVRKSATAVNSQATLDIPTVLREAAGLVATDLINAVYPVKILLVRSDGSLVLNYGQGSLAIGQLLRIYGKGTALQDGDRVIIDENPVGYARVTDVGANSSQAVFVGGGCGPMMVGYTARNVQANALKAAEQAIKASTKKGAPLCPAGAPIPVKG